jgi:F0F1-type ATP synthase, alpha subunit
MLYMSGSWFLIVLILISSLPVVAVYIWFRIAKYQISLVQFLSGSSGFVVQVGDSVATVYGLNDAVYGEMVEFASGAHGIVFNLEEENAGCVILTGEDLVKDGEEVKRTGRNFAISDRAINKDIIIIIK